MRRPTVRDLTTRRYALLVSLTLVVLVLTGCGRDRRDYYPTAYGVPGQCYYVHDPIEVTGPGGLWSDRRCDSGWAPTLMPIGWHNSYAYYYDSPRYLNRYLPEAQRGQALESMKTYERDHAGEIKTASRTATYTDSKGRTYTGKSLSPSAVGGGARGGAGGGSRSKTCGLSAVSSEGAGTVLARGGSSGGGSSGGGSSGGGSRGGSGGGSRGGSGGSTGGGSKSRSGC
ncbi:MAG: hypothetical protein M3Z02_04060 [Actinomycetota bacterium]|nr:hypothetical protein [Actinomycetota bacterium]